LAASSERLIDGGNYLALEGVPMVGEGRTKLVVDVALFSGDSVLLVKYHDVRKYDGETGWFLPDDFLVHGEDPKVAGERILREQVGKTRSRLRIGFIESFADGAWHIIFHYVGRVSRTFSPRLGRNVSDAKWFRLARLPRASDVAHHGWALQTIRKVRKPD
jgi:ADP-ribose pyrophosphatase YjhB (NUDIX family)